MLYVSTRNNTDSYTAYRALHEDRAPDGGLFVPYRLHVLSATELAEMTNMTFGERVARVLNIFFPVGMNGWDVGLAIGRSSWKLARMNHKLYIAELWRNLQADFSFTERTLYTKLCENEKTGVSPTSWARIAIRIAMLFGIYGELAKLGVKNADFTGFIGDYAFISAAWYAKKMGLPINKIICASDESGGAWELFHKGEFSFAGNKSNSNLPLFDTSNLQLLEVLIYEFFGTDEVVKYLQTCDTKGIYRMDDEQLASLNQSMDGAAVSRVRCLGLIRSIFRTHDYISDPFTAITYGALQDYRARTGESRATVLISDSSPTTFATMVSEATGLLPAEIRKRINNC